VSAREKPLGFEREKDERNQKLYTLDFSDYEKSRVYLKSQVSTNKIACDSLPHRKL